MAWKCALCAFTALVLSMLFTHYNSRHAGYECRTITYNLNGCTKQYTKLRSFVCHAYGRHALFLQCSGPNETGGEPKFTRTSDEQLGGYAHNILSGIQATKITKLLSYMKTRLKLVFFIFTLFNFSNRAHTSVLRVLLVTHN